MKLELLQLRYVQGRSCGTEAYMSEEGALLGQYRCFESSEEISGSWDSEEEALLSLFWCFRSSEEGCVTPKSKMSEEGI